MINKNIMKIMEVLINDRLYLNQIYELSKIKSKNNLIKNLEILVRNKILKKEKNKSNTFYSINYNNNLSLSILNLINMIKFQKLPFEKRKAIEDVIVLSKPNLVILFGSTAKGNFTKQSDIDLLLVYNKRPKIDIKEITERYGVKINQIILEFKELDERNETVKHILKTGYPLTGYLYFYKILNKLR